MTAWWPSWKTNREVLTRNLYVPLGKSNSDQISVQSDSWLGHQGVKTKNTKSAITPELMAGSSSCTLSGWRRVQLKEYVSENVDNCEQPLTTLLELITILVCQ
jgi:hypothetical protein